MGASFWLFREFSLVLMAPKASSLLCESFFSAVSATPLGILVFVPNWFVNDIRYQQRAHHVTAVDFSPDLSQ